MVNAQNVELIDSTTVEEITTLSRRHIDRLEKAGRFPKRIRLGYRIVRWVRHEVEEWRQQQMDARFTSEPGQEE